MYLATSDLLLSDVTIFPTLLSLSGEEITRKNPCKVIYNVNRQCFLGCVKGNRSGFLSSSKFNGSFPLLLCGGKKVKLKDWHLTGWWPEVTGPEFAEIETHEAKVTRARTLKSPWGDLNASVGINGRAVPPPLPAAFVLQAWFTPKQLFKKLSGPEYKMVLRGQWFYNLQLKINHTSQSPKTRGLK